MRVRIPVTIQHLGKVESAPALLRTPLAALRRGNARGEHGSERKRTCQLHFRLPFRARRQGVLDSLTTSLAESIASSGSRPSASNFPLTISCRRISLMLLLFVLIAEIIARAAPSGNIV